VFIIQVDGDAQNHYKSKSLFYGTKKNIKKLVKEFRLGDTGRTIEKARICCITDYSINWFAGSWRHEQAV
jgi:hypothetical protein